MDLFILAIGLMMQQPATAATTPDAAVEAVEKAEPAAEENDAKAAVPASVVRAEAEPVEKKDGDDWEEHETLLSGGDVSFGGFGGPQVRFTQFGGAGAVLVGGRGGWLIDHRLVIGGAGYGGSARLDTPIRTIDGEFDNLGIGYGGFLLEYFLWPGKAIHFSVATLLGAGGLSVNDMDDHMRDDFESRRDPIDRPGLSDAFFVVEPELLLEFNLTKWMRLAAGGSYRFVYGVSRGEFESELGNEDISGASGTLLLRFGKF